MPELPEVETVRRSLEPLLTGLTILNVSAAADPACPDPDAVLRLADHVAGHSIEGIDRRAKYMLVKLSNERLAVVHLRMTGQLTKTADAEAVRFERLRLALSDHTWLVFADQRRFGGIWPVSIAEWDDIDSRLGPEPLSPRFTTETLRSILANRKAPIKSVLLNQEAIAGIGNIYADEALFRARLHPQRIAGELDREEVKRLHRQIRKVLNDGLENRGTSFSSYVDGTGAEGQNQETLLVYGLGRGGHPCSRCGQELRFLTNAGRTSHYCGHCQPLNH